VIGLGVVAALASAALLPWLHFDFNPLHLRSARTESVATLLDLAGDADRTINTLEAIRPSLAAADRLAAVVRTVPVVASARTLSSFIPGEQSAKLAVIADAAELLDLAVNPLATLPTPDDAAITASLATTRDALDAAARADPADAAEARRLAQELAALARSAPAAREAASQALIPGVVTLLEELRQSLQAQPVSLATLPPDLVRDWLAPDGRARISILPRGDSNDNAVLTQFVDTTLRTVPDATGAAVATRAAGRAIVGAFTEAGLLSFIAITALLLVTLRRIRDVAITMAPIVLTGLLTMASCVLIGQPLNFANIIALPLLFGIGVAFHIYFVMSWRSGGSHLLTSSLARAVFFSALSTATGFGSLWASSHPGTASMGELLMISLVWTLLSALLFQPALMGPPPAVATQ
jgi:hopanoid biosynthesis associated RND transporter like protein HpnN